MTKLKVLPFAKLQAVIFGIFGLIAGVLYSIGGFLMDLFVTLGWISSTQTPGLSYGTILAFGALIGMPLIAMIIGFIVGLVGAVLYNLLGIKLNF